MKLFVFDHCPYCTRARLAAAFKGLSVETVFVANDDADTPTSLIGKKAVPILQKDDGTAMGESLDIARYFDDLRPTGTLAQNVRPELQEWIDQAGEIAKKLWMPRCSKIGLPEFKTQSAIDYFDGKKEEKIGSFDAHLKNTDALARQIEGMLSKLERLMASERAMGEKFGMEDILAFPMLRNLTMVKAIVWPQKVKAYVENVAKIGKLSLFFDRAI